MNRTQLAKRIGNVDEKYLEETREDLGYGTPSEQEKKGRGRMRPKGMVILAAALLVLATTAFAAHNLGLREVLLPKTENLTPAFPNEDVEGDIQTDAISLAGYVDTPEARATAQWQAYLSACDMDAILAQVGNSVFGGGTSYTFYQVYTQEMADALDDIVGQYDLRLHTDITLLDDSHSREDLCRMAGGDFLGENQMYSGYIYEDGTFHMEGTLEVDGYGPLDYQFLRCVRGTFTDISLTVGHIDEYTQWSYTTSKGAPVTLAISPQKSIVLVNLPDSFVTINVLAGSESTEEDIFSSGPITARLLEQLADSFDFSLLTPAAPWNG